MNVTSVRQSRHLPSRPCRSPRSDIICMTCCLCWRQSAIRMEGAERLIMGVRLCCEADREHGYQQAERNKCYLLGTGGGGKTPSAPRDVTDRGHKATDAAHYKPSLPGWKERRDNRAGDASGRNRAEKHRAEPQHCHCNLFGQRCTLQAAFSSDTPTAANRKRTDVNSMNQRLKRLWRSVRESNPYFSLERAMS